MIALKKVAQFNNLSQNCGVVWCVGGQAKDSVNFQVKDESVTAAVVGIFALRRSSVLSS